MNRSNEMTKQYLSDAGITEGMRVMELGCGKGDVTQIIAELVGPTGCICATDYNKNMLTETKQAMTSKGFNGLSVACINLNGDIETLYERKLGLFDAIVCRRVLMYLTSPSQSMRKLSALLTDRGVFIAEEADLNMVPASVVPFPARNKANEYIKSMLLAEKASITMGFDLPNVFDVAGYSVEGIRAHAVIEGQGLQFDLEQMLPLLSTRLQNLSIANNQEIENLVNELTVEKKRTDAVYISGMSFCAWGRRK
ncbi:methyltransferase domain-containing protein [Ningiella sp. W23]|uniref:methyltransferase domain-containing protein n=1 Tax=Ningiella sp. W23 TaxID=3023715 RepID=UPI0037579FB0